MDGYNTATDKFGLKFKNGSHVEAIQAEATTQGANGGYSDADIDELIKLIQAVVPPPLGDAYDLRVRNLCAAYSIRTKDANNFSILPLTDADIEFLYGKKR